MYKYAKLLGFLVPFLADRPTEGNLESNEYDDEESQDHANFTENDDDLKTLLESPATKPGHPNLTNSRCNTWKWKAQL